MFHPITKYPQLSSPPIISLFVPLISNSASPLIHINALMFTLMFHPFHKSPQFSSSSILSTYLPNTQSTLTSSPVHYTIHTLVSPIPQFTATFISSDSVSPLTAIPKSSSSLLLFNSLFKLTFHPLLKSLPLPSPPIILEEFSVLQFPIPLSPLLQFERLNLADRRIVQLVHHLHAWQFDIYNYRSDPPNYRIYSET